MNFVDLEVKRLTELQEMAKAMDLAGTSRLKKYDLIMRLLRASAEQQGYIFGGGVLEIVQDGIGFLRSDHLLPGPEDVYVSQSQIRRFGLRTGDFVIGQVRPPKESEKYFGLLRVEAVNGLDPEAAKKRPDFDRLTPIFPLKAFNLEIGGDGLILYYAFDAKGERTGVTNLLTALREAGVTFRDLDTQQNSLEDIFVDLVRNGA